MTPDRLTECMHAVLDGTAAPDEARALEAVLARDADAAEEFAAWKAMFATMKSMPMAHPPEGMVAAIDRKFSAEGQLSSRESVFVSGRTRTPRLFSNGLRTIFRRPDRSDSTQGHAHMNANRKIWTGGAIAVVALGIVVFATGFPPKPENVTGTVVPAERYRAPQAGADAIKLGDQGTATSTATPSDAAGVQAAKTDAGLAADRLSASKIAADKVANQTADKSAGLMADRAMAERTLADRRADLAAADKVAAEKRAELATADKVAADRRAERVADKTVADRRAELATADKAVADKRAELAVADKAVAERRAELATADKAFADKRAERTADRAVADKQAERSADKASSDKKAQ